MLLYRAQHVPSGLRTRSPHDNHPGTRIRGRWFTENLESAYRHAVRIGGDTQIVCVEIADGVAETFRVARTPVTPCGLEPIHYSAEPMGDFVIPRFFAERSELVDTVADEDRVPVVRTDSDCADLAERRAA